MKVLSCILLAVVLADGKGSGPYLYQRPDGRAFFLPSEVVKPLPISELNLQGSEASGSDALREYGPPNEQEVSQNLLNQGLPDVTIEQTFGAQTAGILSQGVAEKFVEISEAKPEVIPTELPTTASQSSLEDNPPISAELPILDFQVTEVTTSDSYQTTEVASQSNQLSQESNVQLNQLISQVPLQYISEQTNQENPETQTTEASVAQSIQLNSQEQETSVQSNQQDSVQYQQVSSTASDLVKATAAVDSTVETELLSTNAVPESVPEQKVQELQNRPDVIATLEKEILTQQADVNQAVSDIASVQSLGQVPEGFLEYGPPGFIEYGPPKGDQENLQNIEAILSNETRRRRFSPRLRHGKN